MRVFIDASCIIAALLSPTGGSAKVLELTSFGEIQAITSQTVIDEVHSKTQKISKSTQEINTFIVQSKLVVRKRLTPKEIKPYQGMIDDQKDSHVIAASIRTHCQYLMTLDKKHLAKPETKQKLKPLTIFTPKELLKEYFQQ